MMDGFPGGMPSMEQQIAIPELAITLNPVGFNMSHTPDGSEAQIHITWVHPMLPLRFTIPFQQLFYLEKFHENIGLLIERTKEAQEKASS